MSNQKMSFLEKYPEYEATIGIEVHIQLKTKSKIFCSCPNRFGDKPNTNICHICAGHPGVLPVLNRKVVDYAITLGLATKSRINTPCCFARKHYMYPDLPKNYQITQNETPIYLDGYIPIELENEVEKKIRLVRIHMEEDAGKNIHTATGESYVDLNRAGTPLLEIVSQPDIASSAEAKIYLTRLHTIVRYLKISNANMEQGSFRADVNVSIKKQRDKQLGTRVEIKNINSFKFIVNAIDYELERQIQLLKSGKKITQETRLWDSKNNKTFFMRSKKEAQDYRYFTEPDLPEIVIDQEWIESIKKNFPELPQDKRKRFKKEYNLTLDEATILTDSIQLADYYEAVTAVSKNPKISSNWILRDLLGYLKEQKIELHECNVTPQNLAQLIIELDEGTINTKAAQTVFLEMAQTGKNPSIIIKEKDLKQIDSIEELETIVLQIIENNPENVKKYQEGNVRVFTFFVGQTMKATKGKGNPKIINELLKKHLKK